MTYILDHTVLFDGDWMHIIFVVLLLAIIVFCHIGVRKMRQKKETLEHDVAAASAEETLQDQKPQVSDETSEVNNN